MHQAAIEIVPPTRNKLIGFPSQNIALFSWSFVLYFGWVFSLVSSLCAGFRCPQLSSILANGTVLGSSNVFYDEKVIYKCKTGYHITTESISVVERILTCTANATWNASVPTCSRKWSTRWCMKYEISDDVKLLTKKWLADRFFFLVLFLHFFQLMFEHSLNFLLFSFPFRFLQP